MDIEYDGQPSADATGDDLSNTDDEDGVTFTTMLVPGKQASINVASVIPVGTAGGCVPYSLRSELKAMEALVITSAMYKKILHIC